MKKYIFRKPPYPIDSVCEEVKKWFLPEKIGGESLHKILFRAQFLRHNFVRFWKNGNFQEHEPRASKNMVLKNVKNGINFLSTIT